METQPQFRSHWFDHAYWRGVWRAAIKHLKGNRLNVAAGAFAFRWFLSIFPIIIALLGIAALVTVPRHVTISLIHGVTESLPSGASNVFSKAITNATTTNDIHLWTVIVAGAVALWSSANGMIMVEEGLDMAYDLKTDRTFLKKRIVALPLLLGAVIFGGGASALVIFGPQLGNLFKDSIPVAGSAFDATWTVLRWIIALILINFLFSLLYCVAPNRAAKLQLTSPGAVVATVLWALITLGFSYYTAHFGSYGRTYGAFAGVAILIFWLYLTGFAIFIGGELNAAVERVASGAES